MKQKTPDEDEQLVSLYRDGNVSAFNTLLIRYIPKIRQAVRRFLSNSEDINDVLQDICIHVGTKLKNTYNENGKFSGWLTCVVANYMCSYCRKKKITFSFVDLEAVKVIESEYMLPTFAREQKLFDLQKSVEELPDELKKLVEMKFKEKMTLQAIADKLGMKKTTVAAKLNSAYRKLEKSMLHKGYDDALI